MACGLKLANSRPREVTGGPRKVIGGFREVMISNIIPIIRDERRYRSLKWIVTGPRRLMAAVIFKFHFGLT